MLELQESAYFLNSMLRTNLSFTALSDKLTVNFTMCNVLKGKELEFDPSASWNFPFFCELIHGL
jgi:hypothetical protein